VLKKFGESLDTPSLAFLPNFSWAFVWMDPVNVPAKFEVCTFTLPEIIGVLKKNCAVPGYACTPLFSKIFDGLLFRWTLSVYRSNLKSVVLRVHEIIAIAVLGSCCEPPILGKGRLRGSWMVPFERALLSSYRPSIVTFHLSLRVSDILPLLCSSMPLFPTPLLVSPKFLHVPLGLGGCPLGYEERRCWTNCACN